MIETTWKYKIDKTIPYVVDAQQKDVIEAISVTLIAQDNEDVLKRASWSTTLAFDVDDGVDGDFLALTDITNETLETWLREHFGTDFIDSVITETIENANNIN